MKTKKAFELFFKLLFIGGVIVAAYRIITEEILINF